MMLSEKAAILMAKEVVNVPWGYSTLMLMAETMKLKLRIQYFTKMSDSKGKIHTKITAYGLKFQNDMIVNHIKKEIYDGLPELPIEKIQVRA